ncbi:MAG: peptide chain release factor-like protein [Chloroflexi bacterium]|nr:peptide chain release factor-like protein [Ktedonobacteraceae bacterium]MBV9708067.1 peptide chain release factor-like protein [Chloroflexota bacterium]
MRGIALSRVYATDRASLERDCDVQFFVATGPGGQHRNKVETGVRLTHRPSGISVTAAERRSQHANREVAFMRMAQRLQEMQHVQTPRQPTHATEASRIRRLEAKRHAAMVKRQRSTSVEDM